MKREVPVTEIQPDKSRKGIYVIQDQYFRFWFRFIMPSHSFIEEHRQDFVLKQLILPFLDQFLGNTFEQICIEYVKQISGSDDFPFQINKISRYWQGATEIDIVAFDMKKEQLFLAECKWSTKPVGTNILDNLIQKSLTSQNEVKAKNIYFGIFSKTGFTDALKKLERPDLFLYDLTDLELMVYPH